jgi:HK97 gp10 family phage protein
VKTVFGFDQAQAFLKKIGDDAEKRMERAMKKATLVVETAAKENIRNGRSDWPALSPLTLLRKKDDRMLWDKGTLLRSIHSEVEATRGVIGSGLIYSPVHEFGTTSAGANNNITIPARPYLEPAANENLDKIREVFIDEMKAGA